MPHEVRSKRDLRVGKRIIHRSHGEGRVTSLNRKTKRITVQFEPKDGAQYSKMWRILIGLDEPSTQIEDDPKVASAGHLVVTVAIDKVLDTEEYVWSVPDISPNPDKLRAVILKRIKRDPLTVDLTLLKSIEIGGAFARTLDYLRHVDRGNYDELLMAAVELIDFVTVRYMRQIIQRQGTGREQEFEYVDDYIGKSLWLDRIYPEGASQAMRRELDKIFLSLARLICGESDDPKLIKKIAVDIIRATENRLAFYFREEMARRSTMPPEKLIVRGETEVISASA